jgi:uncharacterized membrane protein YgcG
VAARRGKEGQSQPAPAQQDTQLATLLKASQAAQLRGVLEHARELARVQTEAASAQAAVTRLRSAAIGHVRELAQVQATVAALRGELRSRDAEIAELKRAHTHTHESAADVGGADGGGGSSDTAVGASGGGGGGGGGTASGLQQLHASHQALHQVKQEKANVGELLVGKGEL